MSDLLSFEDQVVIITGSGGVNGLGECYAKLLASRGAAVVINDILPTAEDVAERIRQSGGKAIAIRGSVADEASVKELVDATIAKFGKITGLINNAGQVYSQDFHTMPLEKARAFMDVHFWGTVLMIKAVYPHMKKQGGGRILNITSSTVYGMEEWLYYGAAKAAILTLTKGLALESKADNVFMNAMAPTGLSNSMMAGVKHKEILELPQVKAAKPELNAPLAAYLVHPSCNVTGRGFFTGAGHISAIEFGSSKGIETDYDLTIEKARDAIESGRVDADYKNHNSALDQMAHS